MNNEQKRMKRSKTEGRKVSKNELIGFFEEQIFVPTEKKEKNGTVIASKDFFVLDVLV